MQRSPGRSADKASGKLLLSSALMSTDNNEQTTTRKPLGNAKLGRINELVETRAKGEFVK